MVKHDEPKADPSARVGELLNDRYRIGEVLGEGGMGVVYRAVHELIDKPVAVKILHQHLQHHPEIITRFHQEARAAANIDHPNVCAANDFGLTEQGELYLVMDLVEGETLANKLQQERALAPSFAVEIGAQICSALERAHGLGIVHRDIKPENLVLVSDQTGATQVKILDFGIARVRLRAEDDIGLTKAGVVYGSPHYMSPEQAAGASVDGRADLYTLGVVLFEMLAGCRPFESENLVSLIRMHMMRRPPALRQLAPSVPVALDSIVARLLSKSPDDRFQSAAELGQALRSVDVSSHRVVAPKIGNVALAGQAKPTLPVDTPSRLAALDLEVEVPDVPPRVVALIPRELSERYGVVAIWREAQRIFVAMTDPSDHAAIDELAFLTGYEVEALGASEDVIRATQRRGYGVEGA